MTKESLEISDRLDPRVREALTNALSPFNAKHFVGMSVEQALCTIAKWDKEQHDGAVMHKVVPRITSTYQPFKLTARRTRRMVR
jgi:hypothetical protein